MEHEENEIHVKFCSEDFTDRYHVEEQGGNGKFNILLP
jgi:hypothetical protein